MTYHYQHAHIVASAAAASVEGYKLQDSHTDAATAENRSTQHGAGVQVPS